MPSSQSRGGPRFRTRGTIHPPNLLTNYEVYTSDGHRNSGSSVYSSPIGETEWTSDWVVPQFRSRVAKGEVFFNSYSHHKLKYEHTPGTSFQLMVLSGDYYYTLESSVPGASTSVFITEAIGAGYGSLLNPYDLISTEDLLSVQTEASTGALNKRGRSDNNLWEDLAELDKTAGMILKPLAAFDNFNKKFARENRGFFKNISKSFKPGENIARNVSETRGFVSARALGDMWLAWQYGAKPAMSSISGVLQGLKRPIGKQRRTSRSSAENSKIEHLILPYRRGDGWNYDIQIQKMDKVSCRAMVLDEVDISVANNIGFTGKGLITLPWELVRFSFVVDWFVNVGDFLGAVAPAYGWNQLGSALVTRREQRTQWQLANNFLSGGLAASFNLTRNITGTFYSEKTSTSRGGLAAPGVTIKQNFRLTNVDRALSALSLALQSSTGIWKGFKL